VFSLQQACGRERIFSRRTRLFLSLLTIKTNRFAGYGFGGDFLIDYIKKICFDMLGEMVFSDTVLGTVESVNPLSVKISDKIILRKEQMILSRNVSDFIFEITVDPLFPEDVSNQTDFKKRKKCFVYNSLKKGERVILAKADGGQVYFVIDRFSENKESDFG